MATRPEPAPAVTPSISIVARPLPVGNVIVTTIDPTQLVARLRRLADCRVVMADPTLLASRFGAAISAARRARTWSQDVLAERLDVSKNHIGYIERGERAPSLDVAVRLAKVLGLSLDSVFLEAAEAKPERAFQDEASALLAGLPAEMRIPILEMLKAASRAQARERPPSRHGRKGKR